MISLIGGALLRFLPNIGGWLAGIIGGWVDDKREEKATRLQLEIERERGKNQLAIQGLQNEHTEALNLLLAQQDELRQTIADRQSARNYASTLHKTITETLKVGKDLGVWQPILSIGWGAAVAVEVLSAAVQPMIAATVFTMWGYWKYQVITEAGKMVWTAEDWELMAAVVGFFLAGRVLARIASAK